MTFLMLTILKALTRNRIVLKRETTHNAQICFLKIVHFQNACTNETGISCFYKMVVAVLKMFHKKEKPKIIQCRNYKAFNEQLFRIELGKVLAKTDRNNTE